MSYRSELFDKEGKLCKRRFFSMQHALASLSSETFPWHYCEIFNEEAADKDKSLVASINND